MRIRLWNILGVGCLAIAATGCDSPTRTGTNVNVDAGPVHVDKKPGEVNVNTGPGGVDVEVGRKPGKPAVDVETGPGGVNVDVDGEKIRERIQERREERELENATK